MSKNSTARAIIKELALQAKQRLKNCNYGSHEENMELKRSLIRHNNLRLLTSHECQKPEITIKIINDTVDDENFKNRVYTLLQENQDTASPLASLIDQDAFSLMNEIEREKYILNMSDRYLKVREKYINSSMR